MRRYQAHYMNGYYTPISGHVEKGEGVTEAMIREAKEEAGIDLMKEDLSMVYSLHRLDNEKEYIDFFFTTKQWSGKLTNMEPEKCDDMKWFPKTELPEKEYPHVKFVRSAIQRGETFGEYKS